MEEGPRVQELLIHSTLLNLKSSRLNGRGQRAHDMGVNLYKILENVKGSTVTDQRVPGAGGGGEGG